MPLAKNFIGSRCQTFHRLTYDGKVRHSCFRELQTARQTLKQGCAQLRLQSLELLADRSLREVQLLGCMGEVKVAGRRFKRAEPVQWR